MTFYRHYNGGEYEGIGKAVPTSTIEGFEPLDYWFMVATHTETLQYMNVYYDDTKTNYYVEGNQEVMVYCDKTGRIWVRPYEMFMGNVIKDGVEQPRFAEIDFQEIEIQGVDRNE